MIFGSCLTAAGVAAVGTADVAGWRRLGAPAAAAGRRVVAAGRVALTNEMNLLKLRDMCWHVRQAIEHACCLGRGRRGRRSSGSGQLWRDSLDLMTS